MPVLWPFFLIEVLVIVLILVLFGIALLNVGRHRGQQSLFVLSFLFLLVHVRIRLLLLDHADLLLPYRVRRLFELGVGFLEFVAVACDATAPWVDWKYSSELVARYVLIYQIVVEAYPLAVLFDCHSAYIAVLHRKPLLSFDNHVKLPALLDAQLEDLESVLYQVVLHIKVDAGVRAEARHVVDLEHPRLQLVVQHHIEAKQVAADVGLLGLARTVEMLQLRLHNHERLDDYLLDLMPNLISFLPICPTVAARRHELPFQDIAQPQLMFRAVEVLAVPVQRIVRQMNIGIVEALGRVVLLAC